MEWHDILNMMKGKNLQTRLLYSARLSFRFEGESKTFTDKQKLREFSNTKPALQQTLKELLQAEKKRQQQEIKMPQITRLTSKGICTVKIQNHPRKIMPPKSEIVRRGGYKCRTLEMHLQLRDQQLQTSTYIYIQRETHIKNFRVTANQKSTIDTQTSKKNQLKYNTKDSYQITRGEKKRRQEKRTTKISPKQSITWQ